ncbi:hypothetical protein BGZ76_008648 [Entomortierella beljakovae]|nr:hypothetical protein BGZ76_008648 [Entomortierella beljakovae]
MFKSVVALAVVATTMVSAQSPIPLDHISFTQPVGEGITYVAGTNQTFSWTMACTPPSTFVSATPNATEVDFMDSNNINNAFFVKKVGTIDCTNPVGNLVWTVPADTKPGVYALQLLLTPTNTYSGRFNVTAAGGSSSPAPASGGNNQGGNGNTGAVPPKNTSSESSSVSVSKTMGLVAAAAGVVASLML